MRLMATSLSKLVNNLTEGIHSGCCSLKFASLNNNLILDKCLSCNKDYSRKLDEKLKERCKNTFKLSNTDIKKFILLVRKGIYPYEYMQSWERFDEKSLPRKKAFYSELYIKI